MKKAKRIWIGILSALCTLCLSFSFVACDNCGGTGGGNSGGGNSGGGFELQNWENEQTTAEFQDIYNLPIITTVQDQDGNEYDVTVKVYDKDRNEVMVSAYQFIVEDMDGYTIEYTAMVGSTPYVKTITVSVQNMLAPTLLFDGEITSVELGESITLPTASATSATGATLSVEYHLYQVVDDVRTEITYSGNTVTLEESGDYCFVASATDPQNNQTATKTLNFSILRPAATGEVQYFDTAESVVGMSGRPADIAEWCETFNGRDGLAKMTWSSAEEHAWVYLYPRLEKADYATDEHIVISMYVEDPDNALRWLNFTENTPADSQYPIIRFEPVRGRWHDYIFPIDVFLEYFDGFATAAQEFANGTASKNIFSGRRYKTGADIVMYIDKIYTTIIPEVTFEQGAKIDNMLVGGSVQSFPTATSVDNDGTTPLDVSYNLYAVAVDGTETLVPHTNGMTFNTAGNYVFRASATNTRGGEGHADIAFTVEPEPEQNEIQNFSSSASIQYNGTGMAGRAFDSTAEWLASYQGRNGVAKIPTTSKYDFWWFFFAPRQEKSAYESYTHIVISMYVEDPDNTIERFNYTEFTGFETVAPVVGQWHEYTFTIDMFMDHYDEFFTAFTDNNSAKISLKRAKSGANANVYIDGIYATILPEVTFAQGATIGEMTVGDTLQTFPTATSMDTDGTTALTVGYKLYSVATNGARTEVAWQNGMTFTTASNYVFQAYATNSMGGTGVAEIAFTVAPAPETTEIQNFSYQGSLMHNGKYIFQRSRQGYANTSVWLEEFAGRSGVAKFVEQKKGQTANIYFAPRQDKSAYAGYTHIVFSMYIEDANNRLERFNFTGDSQSFEFISNVTRNAWTEYAVPIDMFLNNYDNFGAATDLAFLALRRFNNTNAGDIVVYIDSIYVANWPTAKFETSLSDQTVGTAFTLPTATVQNGATVVYTLTKPDTSTETVTAGQTYTATTAGAYTLTVNVTSEDGVEVSASITFNVT